jgi:hypothetical protein
MGAVLDGAAAEALVLVTGAGFPPQAAANTTTDNPAPIADRRAAMFTHLILNASPESTLNVLADPRTRCHKILFYAANRD